MKQRPSLPLITAMLLGTPSCTHWPAPLTHLKTYLPKVRQHLTQNREAIRTALPEKEATLTLFSKNVNGVPFIGNAPEKHKAAMEEFLASGADIGLFQEVIDKERLKHYEHPDFYMIHPRLDPEYPWNFGGLLILSRKKPDHAVFTPYEEQGNWHSLQLSDRAIRKGFLTIFFAKTHTAIINTHLLANYGKGAANNPGNKAQLRELVAYVTQLKQRGWHVIIGGDFNFTEEAPQHKIMSTIASDQTRSTGPTSSNGKRIDYFWDTNAPRPEPDIVIARPNRPNLSDHRSVIYRLIQEGRGTIQR